MCLGLPVLNPGIQWVFPLSPRLDSHRCPLGKDCVKLRFWMVETKASLLNCAREKGLGLTQSIQTY